jgi:hypothetical protein
MGVKKGNSNKEKRINTKQHKCLLNLNNQRNANRITKNMCLSTDLKTRLVTCWLRMVWGQYKCRAILTCKHRLTNTACHLLAKDGMGTIQM